MNCNDISIVLGDLKVNSTGRIIGKSRAIDKLESLHITKLDSELMDIRIFVAGLSTKHSTTEDLKMIDEYIYQKQIS